ncbi:L-serine ammonia-lyase [Confluentibacter flavum]|uniref:L-serine dehydratase n=1 Tax=Confluentibacter flavum TaxID=1909700 RepID=A0A2N3HHG8_9FLAO|nr:L-serine ammonia-lyase [Confluentibacter flavum]PKQ44415.1 L-serine ammonia-lyase [Confluentibacter flavum]
MEYTSVFDMFKIGVGPSSSHTLGPWIAGRLWIKSLKERGVLNDVCQVTVHLYGSLALTGKGHGTDFALILGLSDADPETIMIRNAHTIVENVNILGTLFLGGDKGIAFNSQSNILFHKKFLPFHANGLKFQGILNSGRKVTKTYYSIGGGFVLAAGQIASKINLQTFNSLPFPVRTGGELLEFCEQKNLSISQLVLENERSLRSDAKINLRFQDIWSAMLDCVYMGCHNEGILPGGLNVKRRAPKIYQNLKNSLSYSNPHEWLDTIRATPMRFRQIFQWVSCFALAVNEENASFGRVVTAPTNGSAGVIPAVLLYYLAIEDRSGNFEQIKKFYLVAGAIGSIFKTGATISAAMGGCQAEIGVSSAMAAGGLTELMGGNPAQVLMAAEIAMEHHLGLTCDPIGGLVQIPCIERNSMGAIKAINAAELALNSNPKEAKVSLDKVVATMWETAKDMDSKYKETAEGGLAITVGMSEC